MNSSPSAHRPDFGLIIVGDEILSGKRADKHMSKVIELLSARGLALSYADYVGDSPERITQALRRAFESGDVVYFIARNVRIFQEPCQVPLIFSHFQRLSLL